MCIGMIVVYMVSAIGFGWFADKQLIDRRYLLAFGIIFWSITTALAGLSQNLIQLIIFRSLVGVGEAAYGTIAPPMLFDFFPSHDRNVTYGVYYLAIPVGAALGFGFGSVLASIFGWRWAFVACGIPGIVVAMLIIKLNNPIDGINDAPPVDTSSSTGTDNDTVKDTEIGDGIESGKDTDMDTEALLSPMYKKDDDISKKHIQSQSSTNTKSNSKSQSFHESMSEIYEIVSNPVFFLCVLGLAANNFALGGIADWITVFMERYQKASLEEAGLVVGAATVCGGIIGTYLGSVTTSYYDSRINDEISVHI